MMKGFFVLLVFGIFIFIFSVIDVEGVSTGRDMTYDGKEVLGSISKKDSIATKCSDEEINGGWLVAEASYYNSMDSTQTKSNPDGIGASGRLVESGSISLGSVYTSEIMKEKKIVFVQIKNLDIVTPYGKGIFRVDDAMHKRYNQEGRYFIDFLDKDLSEDLKRKGRFNVEFKFV